MPRSKNDTSYRAFICYAIKTPLSNSLLEIQRQASVRTHKSANMEFLASWTLILNLLSSFQHQLNNLGCSTGIIHWISALAEFHDIMKPYLTSDKYMKHIQNMPIIARNQIICLQNAPDNLVLRDYVDIIGFLSLDSQTGVKCSVDFNLCQFYTSVYIFVSSWTINYISYILYIQN